MMLATIREWLPVALAMVLLAEPSRARSQSWVRQIGTSGGDYAMAATSDNQGGVYVGGATNGSITGVNAGTYDAWLARYDDAGNQTWVRQFGSNSGDEIEAVAANGSSGVYVGGSTSGSLGAPLAGEVDAWLASYDNAGNQNWVRQLGTAGWDEILAAASDGATGVYVGGVTTGTLGGPSTGTYAGWLARFDVAGNQVWIRQLISPSPQHLRAVAPDGSSGVYVAGSTGGSQVDGWLARYDSNGNQLWITQLGTSGGDAIFAAASDGSSGVFVTGFTTASLGTQHLGSNDVWVARFDGAGSQQWIRQFGTAVYDLPYAATPDGVGGVYLGGVTHGSLGGPLVGNEDAWLARYDGTGNQLWLRQYGTSSNDRVTALATRSPGGVYPVGRTDGDLGGPNLGQSDAWVARDGVFECYVDSDFDGFGAGSGQVFYSPCGSGFAPVNTDCDDADASVFPGATEICDGLDNDCNGTIDDGFLATYCTAGTTVQGCVPSIGGEGTPSSISESGFDIVVGDVPTMRVGLIFYGMSPTGQSWGLGSSSYLCIFYPVLRTGAHNSGGSIGACDGELRIDFNTWMRTNPAAIGSPFVAGQVFHAQGWFRDPGAPKQTNLSDGLRFVLCQ